MGSRRWLNLALLILSLVTGTASADEGFTYTGIEGGYNAVPGSGGQGATGWYSAGTLQLPRRVDAVSLSGAYFSSSGYGQTTGSLSVGLNYHWSITEGFDLVSDTLYCRNTATTATTYTVASGYALDAGLHVQVTTAWDVSVILGRQRMGAASASFVQVAPVLDLGNSLSLSLAWLRATDGSIQVTTGIRYDF